MLTAYRIWWSKLSPIRQWGPVVFVLLYVAVLFGLHGFRQDHFTTCAAIIVLAYGGPWLDSVFRFILPLIATGVVYDSQRFYEDYIRGPIHVSEPYRFDKYFFGIQTAQGILTPNEWFQLHTHPVLDVITGFAYLFFIAIFVLFCAYFVFYLPRKMARKMAGNPSGKPPSGTRSPSISVAELVKRAPAMMWSFFWLNVAGYSTYYWYAAAPPWYVAEHGLGPADLTVLPNPAGCLRFDQIMGTHFFTGMYGRSADVFGAIPSLHVAYPLVAIYFALRFGAGRIFAVLFYLTMCFSAVYLNHHYLLDIIWGSTYAVIVSMIVDRYYLGVARRTNQITAPAAFTSSFF
jgi:membrane-associated phospholipid phosphatase